MIGKNQWISEEIKEEVRKYLETNENKHIFPKPMGCSKSSSKRKAYRHTGLPQKPRNISNKEPNLPSKGIRKRTSQAQGQQKEGNNKDQRGNQ